MKMPGHETRSIFDRYDIVDERNLEEAAEKQQKKSMEFQEKQQQGVSRMVTKMVTITSHRPTSF